jgi:hypothetical protein
VATALERGVACLFQLPEFGEEPVTIDHQQQVIALLRGAADNHEPIEKFGSDHGYSPEAIETAKSLRIEECRRTPLTEWHASTWDEMQSAADRLEGVW